jgi:hypothetical protein
MTEATTGPFFGEMMYLSVCSLQTSHQTVLLFKAEEVLWIKTYC